VLLAVCVLLADDYGVYLTKGLFLAGMLLAADIFFLSHSQVCKCEIFFLFVEKKKTLNTKVKNLEHKK